MSTYDIDPDKPVDRSRTAAAAATVSCPNCEAAVPVGTSVCPKCGRPMPLDTSTLPRGKVVSPAPAAAASPTAPEFSTAAPGKQKLYLIVGCVLALGAAIATIYYGGRHEVGGFPAFMRQIGRAVLTLYNIALHTGTGVLAVWVAAVYSKQRFGSFESAVARMFMLVSTFFLLLAIELPLGQIISGITSLILASGLYWLLAMVTFNKKAEHVNTLALVHLTLFFVFWLGVQLVRWVESGPERTDAPTVVTPANPTPTPAPAPAPVLPATGVVVPPAQPAGAGG